MAKYICKRILQSLVTLVVVATVVFLLLRLMPEEGYFAEGYDKMDEVQIEAALTEMGLRDPLPVQLKNFFVGLCMGILAIDRFPSEGPDSQRSLDRKFRIPYILDLHPL